MIIHTRQAWWCDVINEPFIPQGFKLASLAHGFSCPHCHGVGTLDDDEWPRHRLILTQIPKDEYPIRADLAAIHSANTDLREALAFLLDQPPDDGEARDMAERVLAETEKADPGAA